MTTHHTPRHTASAVYLLPRHANGRFTIPTPSVRGAERILIEHFADLPSAVQQEALEHERTKWQGLGRMRDWAVAFLTACDTHPDGPWPSLSGQKYDAHDEQLPVEVVALGSLWASGATGVSAIEVQKNNDLTTGRVGQVFTFLHKARVVTRLQQKRTYLRAPAWPR